MIAIDDWRVFMPKKYVGYHYACDVSIPGKHESFVNWFLIISSYIYKIEHSNKNPHWQCLKKHNVFVDVLDVYMAHGYFLRRVWTSGRHDRRQKLDPKFADVLDKKY